VEHLKNTLIGLNEKLTVFNDLKKDLEQAKHMLRDSESHRDQLQNHIEKTAKIARQQAQENKVYQDTLIAENNNLKIFIQNLEQRNAHNLQEHLRAVNELKAAHTQKELDNANAFDKLRAEHS
jgi:hypothetical protein